MDVIYFPLLSHFAGVAVGDEHLMEHLRAIQALSGRNVSQSVQVLEDTGKHSVTFALCDITDIRQSHSLAFVRRLFKRIGQA